MIIAAREKKRLRDAVVRIAAASDARSLPLLERRISPLLRVSSSVYAAVVRARRMLYDAGIFRATRLPVPVVSVGNVTWGGNGKTPMAEFLAWCFVYAGINPIVLTRGYGGGDEARMLGKHFQGSPVRLGVGADRVKSALSILEQCGKQDTARRRSLAKLIDFGGNPRAWSRNSEIGVAILDDGMQHLRIARDVEIVMVNAVTLFGNERMIPWGPLREPLDSLRRAQVIVVHHANLVSTKRLGAIVSILEGHLDGSKPVFAFSEMAPQQFFCPSQDRSLALTSVEGAVVVCISGVGCPDSMSLCLVQLGPSEVHRLDYNDHHIFQAEDMVAMEEKILELKKSTREVVVAVTSEKDYLRHPELWKRHEVLVLCSALKVINSQDFMDLLANTMAN
ncbi:hypothetical protein SELMODRAFT_73554 [Selaginella moellendorffii]|uniref:tetraacyldisaccharide 4'-kinase n=2 Tax=Selaginella moellendorffii TaxID=88036 RepID=D8QQP3_SELML|nr:hypothetical protein SELMODRAFT_73554 [Selaginella moellendorffii]